MQTIEHYAEEKKKFDQVRGKSAVEKQRQLEIVEAYLKGQEAGGMSRKKIMEHYFKKYYRDFLDNPLAESMNKEERYELLKELIYNHEILHEEENNMGARKAA